MHHRHHRAAAKRRDPVIHPLRKKLDRRVTALPRRPGDDTVCVEGVLSPSLESIADSASFNKPSTP
jgi:hypothetical protein